MYFIFAKCEDYHTLCFPGSFFIEILKDSLIKYASLQKEETRTMILETEVDNRTNWQKQFSGTIESCEFNT